MISKYRIFLCCVLTNQKSQSHFNSNPPKKNNIKKGAHSPDMRIVSMGVYPIQKINSQVVGQDDVSKAMRLYQNQKTK